MHTEQSMYGYSKFVMVTFKQRMPHMNIEICNHWYNIHWWCILWRSLPSRHQSRCIVYWWRHHGWPTTLGTVGELPLTDTAAPGHTPSSCATGQYTGITQLLASVLGSVTIATSISLHIVDWMTLVRSRQSMQLTRNTPCWWHSTSTFESTLVILYTETITYVRFISNNVFCSYHVNLNFLVMSWILSINTLVFSTCRPLLHHTHTEGW